MKSWYVYILRCNDNTLYTGVTTDVMRRLNEHNTCNTKGAKYTRARRPLTLVYQESCLNRSQACRREYDIKQLSKKAKEKIIEA